MVSLPNHDPTIGRFISADTIIPHPSDPQSFNRYSYCRNNPLKYTDPTGHFWDWFIDWASIAFDAIELWNNPSWRNAGLLVADVVLAVVPFVPAGVGPITKAVQHGDDVVKVVDKVGDFINDTAKTAKNAGRLGGPEHRGMVKGITELLDNTGIGFKTEKQVTTVGGSKAIRYADVAVFANNGQIVYLQVGRQTKSGLPVAREQAAIADILTTGKEDLFMPYNSGKPANEVINAYYDLLMHTLK